MILADHEIRDLCDPLRDASGLTRQGSPPMIAPFEGEQVRYVNPSDGSPADRNENPTPLRVVSYGLTSFGYDMRAGRDWKIFTEAGTDGTFLIDPKAPPERYYRDVTAKIGEQVIIPPNSYALTSSLEYVRMPEDVLAICLGKSTYARVGIHLNVTPLEPGWEGEVTIEISNATRFPVAVYAGEGIMQVLFLRGSKAEMNYAKRNGKYQGQRGITLARM